MALELSLNTFEGLLGKLAVTTGSVCTLSDPPPVDKLVSVIPQFPWVSRGMNVHVLQMKTKKIKAVSRSSHLDLADVVVPLSHAFSVSLGGALSPSSDSGSSDE